MRERQTVLVDMDGVLADFDGGTRKILREDFPSIPVVEAEDRQNFYFRDDYSDQGHQAIINTIHAGQGFFASLDPIDGALEGWEKLHDLGYRPVICSAPLSENRWCVPEKQQWVQQHLGAVAAREAIFDRRKEKYRGVALIDDRPYIASERDAMWQHVIFSQQYNRNNSTMLRLHDWHDPRMEQVLRHAARRNYPN